jgi:cytoplasmic iron level regulating protein YaaA (DUF328/UPF0246 family)
MLILLSPAKSLDFESPLKIKDHTLPHFSAEIKTLTSQLKKLSTTDLEKMMNISKKLAELNHQRFQNFSNKFNFENSRQALLAFDGDVYAGIAKDQFNHSDFSFAQNHLRILSGLYGLLKPLDLIQPYRLEMGCALPKNFSSKNLYQFWGDKISTHLNEELQSLDISHVINLASEEYFSAINPKIISKPIINIAFKEEKMGKFQIIGINAKRARGLMTNFIIKNKIGKIAQLKNFCEENYSFNNKLSDQSNLVFTRSTKKSSAS